MIPHTLTSPQNDCDAWRPEFNYLYDKLVLSIALGYRCAPHGVDPAPDDYPVISKPITNLYGLGIGCEIWTTGRDIQYKPGHFWMKLFAGAWESFDIDSSSQTAFRAVATQNESKLPVSWSINEIPAPQFNLPFTLPTRHNVETIGGNIIEIHPRWCNEWMKHYHKCPLCVSVLWSNTLESEIPIGWTDLRLDDANLFLKQKRIAQLVTTTTV